MSIHTAIPTGPLAFAAVCGVVGTVVACERQRREWLRRLEATGRTIR